LKELKQCLDQNLEELVRFHIGVRTRRQLNYSTIKKEAFTIALCFGNYQDDLYCPKKKKILLRIDYKSAK